MVVLHGPERYLALRASSELKSALLAKHGDLDTVMFDGESADAAQVLDELRSPNLMMTHKLIIIDRGELFLATRADDADEAEDAQPLSARAQQALDEAKASKAKNREMMERYAAAPDPSSTLLVRAGRKIPAPKFLAAVEAGGGRVEVLEELRQPQLVSFVVRQAGVYGGSIDPDSAAYLVERCGGDLGTLDCELAKLVLASIASAKLAGASSASTGVARPAGQIDRRLIDSMTGLSGEEEGYRFADVLLTRPVPEVMTQLRTYCEVYRSQPTVISIFLCNMMVKLEGFARGLAGGADPRALSGRYKLWGSTLETIPPLARALGAGSAATLLKATVEADAKIKSGADKDLVIEAIVLRLARAFERARVR